MTIKEYRNTAADQEVFNMIRLREKSEHIYASKIAQAESEGLARGVAKGTIVSTQKMLQAGIERKEIARILELPEDGF